MKAPPRPVVLTAGVRDKKKRPTPFPKKGKQSSDGGGGGKQSSDGDASTPPRDNLTTLPNPNPNTNHGVAPVGSPPSASSPSVQPHGLPSPPSPPSASASSPTVSHRDRRRLIEMRRTSVRLDDLYSAPPVILDEVSVEPLDKSQSSEFLWLAFCFFGIMGSFVCYGLLLEFATSGGKHLHELSFLFVTSLLYTVTAGVGRYIRAEEPSTIPPAQFAVLGLTSMGSTFFSVRALRYVIYPIQVLAKSCKPVPVMLMGALMGKKYPPNKYLKVVLIVAGVGLFMGGGENEKKSSADSDSEKDASSQLIGVTLLFISLCFDGGTGAYEDKLMSVHSVGPFDLMYNIQMGKTILAGIGLIVLNQVHVFAQMCQDMGFLLVALGLSGAVGQVFIFVTIAKFGALTCSIIGLARKVTTLVASIYFYGHHLSNVQGLGLVVCIGAMVNDFFGKKGKGGGGHGRGGAGEGGSPQDGFKDASEERQPMLTEEDDAAVLLETGSMKE